MKCRQRLKDIDVVNKRVDKDSECTLGSKGNHHFLSALFALSQFIAYVNCTVNEGIMHRDMVVYSL